MIPTENISQHEKRIDTQKIKTFNHYTYTYILYKINNIVHV